jgi:hypothetical protein
MIHLFCTLEPARISFLSQFTEHYARLGVEKFHVSLQVEPGTDPAAIERFRSAANDVLRIYETKLNAVLVVPFTAQAVREHHDRLQHLHCGEGDWIVWADIDEFQVYPGEFKSLLRLAESFGIDYFRGYFVDRASADGRLKEFDPDQPIWTQYPCQFKPHPRLPLGITEKVACARRTVFLCPGNHFPVNEEPLRYYSESVDVHHFKWDALVIRRLSRRLQPDFKKQCPWWVESKAVLDFLAENDGSIVID